MSYRLSGGFVPQAVQWRLTPSQTLVLGFAAVILTGAMLLMLPAATHSGRIAFVDALFTATSAVCVTGLVVVDTGTYFTPFGQLVILGLIQVGGLGFMTIATLFALIFGKRIHLRERLIMQEALNQLTMEGIVRLTKYVIAVTFFIEGAGALILALRWARDLGWAKGMYFGIFHAISSFCNAGFDLFGGYRSLTGYATDITVNLTVSTLIILGGIGFSVIADLYEHRSFRRLALHSKLVLTVSGLLIVCGTAVIFLLEYNNPATLGQYGLDGKLLGAYFQSVTPRTAGYNTLSIGEMRDATLFFTIILMFIGASPASTGGGIKTSTLGVLAATVLALVNRAEDAQLFERRIPQYTIFKAFTLVLFSLLLVISVTMIISVIETFPFINILFEVTSGFGTVGLTTGITPHLAVASKLLLIMTMFAGRLGPLTLAVAFGVREEKTLLRYPEGRVIIG